MLTKQERAAIAERCKNYGENNHSVLKNTYECLLGRLLPGIKETTAREDCREIAARLLDLCDTSNMVELPLDKDGEVIHIGDVIYDNSGMEWEVGNIRFSIEGASISVRSDDDYSTFRPEELTHKQPVTIKSLAQRIKHVLEDEATSIGVNPYVELGRIAEQLESLGDSDANQARS